MCVGILDLSFNSWNRAARLKSKDSDKSTSVCKFLLIFCLVFFIVVFYFSFCFCCVSALVLCIPELASQHATK